MPARIAASLRLAPAKSRPRTETAVIVEGDFENG